LVVDLASAFGAGCFFTDVVVFVLSGSDFTGGCALGASFFATSFETAFFGPGFALCAIAFGVIFVALKSLIDEVDEVEVEVGDFLEIGLKILAKFALFTQGAEVSYSARIITKNSPLLYLGKAKLAF
jgi:hypothetical protein